MTDKDKNKDKKQGAIFEEAVEAFHMLVAALYPVPRHRPETFAELARCVLNEVQEAREQAHPLGSKLLQSQEVNMLRKERDHLKKERDGFAAANAELGLLLSRPTGGDEAHRKADESIAKIRGKLMGGVIVGILHDVDSAGIGLIVDVNADKHVQLWLHSDERKTGPAVVEIVDECDA